MLREGSKPPSWRRWLWIALAIVAVLAVLAAGVALVRWVIGRFLGPPAELTVVPAEVMLCPSQTQQFTTTVGIRPEEGVSWEATGGTIDEYGLYTAGGELGDYEVRAEHGRSQGQAVVHIQVCTTPTPTPTPTPPVSPIPTPTSTPEPIPTPPPDPQGDVVGFDSGNPVAEPPPGIDVQFCNIGAKLGVMRALLAPPAPAMPNFVFLQTAEEGTITYETAEGTAGEVSTFGQVPPCGVELTVTDGGALLRYEDGGANLFFGPQSRFNIVCQGGGRAHLLTGTMQLRTEVGTVRPLVITTDSAEVVYDGLGQVTHDADTRTTTALVVEGGAIVTNAAASASVELTAPGVAGQGTQVTVDASGMFSESTTVPVDLTGWVVTTERLVLWATLYEAVSESPDVRYYYLFVLDADADVNTGRPAGQAHINPDLGDEVALGVFLEPAGTLSLHLLIWSSTAGDWVDGPDIARMYINESRDTVTFVVPLESLSAAVTETAGVTLLPDGMRSRFAAIGLTAGEWSVDFCPDLPPEAE